MPDTTWHSLTDINGIGPSLAAALTAMDYPFAESLLKSSPINVANDLEPVDGITIENAFTEFIPQAALLRIPNLSVQALNVFHERRIYYSRLAYGSADDLHQTLASAGVEISIDQILAWQLEASKLLNKSTLYLSVVDEDGAPVQNADVFVADPPKVGDGFAWHWVTQENGLALIEHLATGVHEVLAVHGEKYQKITITTGTDENLCIEMQLNRDAPGGVVYDERKDGIDPRSRPWIRRNFDAVSDVPAGELFEVSALINTEARLSTILRKQEGASWVIESISVNLSDLPKPPELGMLFEWSGTIFEHREGTARSVRRGLLLGPAIQSLGQH